MKKRFFAVLLCVIMALSMVACGDSDADKKVGQPSITKLADYKDFEKILTGDYAVTDEKIKDYSLIFTQIIRSPSLARW